MILRIQNLRAFFIRPPRVAGIVGLFLCSLGTAAEYKRLPLRQLEALLKNDCTLVLPWASWCPQCIEEIPELLPVLSGVKELHPLVIDFSKPHVQESFSKPFLARLTLSFPTYSFPMGEDEAAYRKRIDKEWNGSLPLTLLIRCKKNRCVPSKKWTRRITPREIQSLAASCVKKSP